MLGNKAGLIGSMRTLPASIRKGTAAAEIIGNKKAALLRLEFALLWRKGTTRLWPAE
jgi:hypothetical protein